MDADHEWEDQAGVDIGDEQQNESVEDSGEDGAHFDDVVVYLDQERASDDPLFSTDYFWGMYDSDSIATYEDTDDLETNVSEALFVSE
jgi:hypothetical protein